MGALHPPSRSSLHSTSYLIHSVHPPMSFPASPYSRYWWLHPLTSFFTAQGALSWFLITSQSQTFLSSPVTPWVWSSLQNTLLTYLTAPQLLLLLFAHFKSQQKSWLKPPGLINIDITNIPSLGTNWHGWAPAEVGDKLILWRCLPLKRFLVSWKDNLSLLLLKKL